MASGLRDVTTTLGSRIAILFIAIGTQSCLAWSLGPALRGSYAICILFAALLTVVFVVGCDVAGLYFVASKKLTISEGIVHTLIYGLVGCVLAVLAGLVILQLPLEFVTKATPQALAQSWRGVPTTSGAVAILSSEQKPWE